MMALRSDRVIYEDKEWKVVGMTNPDDGDVIIERRVLGFPIRKEVPIDKLRDA